MPTAPDDQLAAGGRALTSGDWLAAKEAFAAALAAAGESPEALVGLAEAHWWRGELAASTGYRERAYALLARQGDVAAAAFVAWQLSLDYRDGLHNPAAGQGWAARARRLVDEHDLAPLRGWVTLLDAHYAVDAVECERLAGRALELARERGDADLELCALSQCGAALVDQGRVVDGVRMLDEAMAGSLGGEGNRLDPVVFTSCNTLAACTSCGDFTRAVQWLRATDRFAQRYGSPYLRADCRIHYAAMLVAIGDWPQAEAELSTAVTLAGAELPALHGDALAGLAGLRLAQGQWEEAARLVAGLQERPSAAAAIGEIHLRQGRPESARTVLQRGLTAIGPDRLRAVALRELLGQALLACEEVAAARQHAAAMVELGAGRECAVAAAYGERLSGRADAAAGQFDDAGAHLERSLAGFVALGMPYEAARTRLLLGESLRSRRPQAAIDEGRAALAALDGLGARSEADVAAALLRELGVPAPRAIDPPGQALTRREQEVLDLLGQGMSNPEIAERLYLSRKTVEHHVARVLSKLGLRSRAEAAAEAVRRRLTASRRGGN
ncbi:hypothetical protein JQS43_22315 [Natronosporangium hydrolyticum]|uniref:HTH luxR-type domain-containing protein n=1 Tax=Natronosporangium hydrolyticum TaxID=2811111 RepID=A0A895Y905_9ACTN|nr:LuxR C-terminal-related transcriptional regulator [Natronosporangium hydrolyticum]QSB14217.1 hypothetical protein JQS43_22315 [Natronosporangium hydrolyticum]